MMPVVAFQANPAAYTLPPETAIAPQVSEAVEPLGMDRAEAVGVELPLVTCHTSAAFPVGNGANPATYMVVVWPPPVV
jgi:hypothetical protein